MMKQYNFQLGTIPFSLNLDDTKFGHKAIASASYELEVLSEMWRLLKKDDLYIDVGGHIGYHAIIAGKLGAIVHTFEPEVSNYIQLCDNIRLNSLSNVRAYSCAITNELKPVKLFYNSDAEGGHSTSFKPEQFAFNRLSAAYPQECSVEGCTLDDLFAESKQKIKLAKIDVEGGEFAVVQGMEELLQADLVENIITEINGVAMKYSGWTFRDLYDLIGMKCRYLTPNLQGTPVITPDDAPFNSPPEDGSVFNVLFSKE